MKHLRLSQERLGRKLGISQPMVAGLLNGTHHLSLDRAKEFGSLLELDPIILLVTHRLEHREDLGQDLESLSVLQALNQVCGELWEEGAKEITELKARKSPTETTT